MLVISCTYSRDNVLNCFLCFFLVGQSRQECYIMNIYVYHNSSCIIATYFILLIPNASLKIGFGLYIVAGYMYTEDCNINIGPLLSTEQIRSSQVLLGPPYSSKIRRCMTRLRNQTPWYVQPCLYDWVIKGPGMSSRVCVTG